MLTAKHDGLISSEAQDRTSGSARFELRVIDGALVAITPTRTTQAGDMITSQSPEEPTTSAALFWSWAGR